MARVNPPMELRGFAGLIATDGTNGWRAEQCLRRVSELSDDAARAELVAGAQVFALLALVEAVQSERAGISDLGKEG